MKAGVHIERITQTAFDGKRHPEAAARVADVEASGRPEDRVRPREKTAERVLPEQRAVLTDREHAAAAHRAGDAGVEHSLRVDRDARHRAGAAMRLGIERPEQRAAYGIDGDELSSRPVTLREHSVRIA